MNATCERPKMTKKPAELRYGDRTIEELESTMRTVKLLVKSIDGTIDAAKKMGVESLRLDGVTKGERAVALLKGFAANVEHAFRREEFGL